MPVCAICSKESTPQIFLAREMVHGTRQVFQYALCGGCGTLALVDPPEDLSPYYRNYYSTSPDANDPFNGSSGVARYLSNRLKKWALRHSIFGKGSLARYIYRRKTVDSLAWGPIFSQLRAVGIPFSPKTRFLDVGSGTGRGLQFLAYAGFTELTGCDPFIEEEIKIVPQGKILKATLDQVQGSFDVIMFHHSFEHVPDPIASLRQAVALLAPGGVVILRFPNIASVEFLKHRGNWWGIHAPRHYFLPSQQAMTIMAEQAAVRIVHAYCDSRFDHYLYSTEYQLDIDDHHPLSFRADAKGLWTEHDLQQARAKADLFNTKLCGDWITYFVQHKSP